MSLNTEKSVLLVGAGQMAIDYSKVLVAMKIPLIVVGRGEKSAKSFLESTNLPIEIGGVDNWLEKSEVYPKYAIVAVTGTELGNVTRSLLRHGIKNILLEKPGGLDEQDIESVSNEALKSSANVLIGYNRRFYASTRKAKEIIEEDGGVCSFTFEFTEWIHKMDQNKDKSIKERWLLHNSTHVIDLAFYLGGVPDKIDCYTSGGFEWHPAGSAFVGAGITKRGILFSYHSNWDAPGRWWVEILTNQRRLIFRPLEQLKAQKRGSVAIDDIKIDDRLDIEFKPGLFRQVEAFLNDDWTEFIDIHEQVSRSKLYKLISEGKPNKLRKT
ncbi:MAG: Gfo/Idh/MocA family oxidoreductase [Promethearchaeota archaeon]